MFKIYRRSEKVPPQPRIARVLHRILLFIVLAGLSGQQHFAPAQPSPASGLDVPARSREILAHLNSVIQFYRDSMQPLQKVGEPNDEVYRDQATSLSSQVAGFAFQSAKAQAALMASYQTHVGVPASGTASDNQQKMQAIQDRVEKQIADLNARKTDLEQQIAIAKPKDVAALEAQRKQIRGALDLSDAMDDSLQKIVSMSDAQTGTGLAADIDRLQRSIPELQSKNKTAAPQLTTLDSARTAGVTSQGSVLFQLLGSRHSLDSLIRENDQLSKQALALRAPVSNILRTLIQQGQQLSDQAAAPAPSLPGAQNQQAGTIAAASSAPGQPAISGQPAMPGKPAIPGQPSIQSITTKFRALSTATVPLSQEIIVLEQSRANLVAWQTSVDREYTSILHSLLLRILVIVLALGIIFGGGKIWTQATNKYIRDIRRRRQFLIVRRIVVGFLSAIVILFGFVTQFNSLATFAGFITAGIAVGLQTVLLSVAAYFFIIGRYGVKVGDRITIAAVTGDVIDVGLVRFYMMELAGNGAELHPTGRVVVFSNAVLFQAGTPLYKQMPGTEYAWHELIVKLTDSANYKAVSDAVMQEVHSVYDGYRSHIEQQHRGVETLMQASIDPPAIESRLQFNAGAFQLWARFPVQIRNASATDEQLTQALLHLMSSNPEIKNGVASTPLIQASVRG